MQTPVPHWIEAGAGPRAMVLLHGVSGGAPGFEALLPLLARPGWRALAWDMPGYGESPALARFDFDGLVDALERLLDAAGLARCVLVGHSLGGMIALQAASRIAHRLDGLVLACSTPAFGASSGAHQQAFLNQRLGALLQGASMADLAADVIPAMLGPGSDPAVEAAAVALMARIAPASYEAALRALVHFDQRSQLPHIRVPTLVLAGSHDKVSTPLVMRRMAERLPLARYEELDAGHMVPFEEPGDFALAVTQFCADLES